MSNASFATQAVREKTQRVMVEEETKRKARAKEARKLSNGSSRTRVRNSAEQPTAKERMERSWRDEMVKLYPGLQVAPWGGKESGLLNHLLEKYSSEVVAQALVYTVRFWELIKARYFSAKNGAGVPSLAWIVSSHQGLCIEVQQWMAYRTAESEYQEAVERGKAQMTEDEFDPWGTLSGSKVDKALSDRYHSLRDVMRRLGHAV
jgi:hypothetical protein